MKKDRIYTKFDALVLSIVIFFLLFFIFFLIIMALPVDSVSATKITILGNINHTEINQTLSKFDIPNYIPEIVIFKHLYKNHYCGWCFFSGKIYLSTNLKCDFEDAIRHELRHAEQFKMKRELAVRWCKDNNLSWATPCWEKYANQI